MTATRTLRGTQPSPPNRDGRSNRANRPATHAGGRRTALLVAVVVFALAAAWTSASSALASTGSVWWKLNSGVLPSNLPQGTDGTIVLTAVNLGDASTSGVETISAVLPPGLKIKEVEGAPDVGFFALGWLQGKNSLGPTEFLAPNNFCEVVGNRVACKYVEGPAAEEPFRPKLPPIAPYEDIEIRIHVTNESAVSGDAVKGEVSGGASPTQTTEHGLDVGTGPAPFGVESEGFSLIPEEEGGAVDTQAGSHPFQLTTTIALNQTADEAKPPALARKLQFNWPPGLIGNASSIPKCSDVLFRTRIPGATANECPASSAVGVAVLNVDEPNQLALETLAVPLFNLEPGYGEPARFGFEFAGSAVTIDASVRTGSDYGVTVSASNITELTNFISSTVTVWGVPSDPSHDNSRGWACLVSGHGIVEAGVESVCPPAEKSQATPFLTLPTSCSVPFTVAVQGDSWPRKADPSAEAQSIPLPQLPQEKYALKDAFGRSLPITGCNGEPFGPLLEVSPDSQAASSPAAGKVNVHVPQAASQNPQGISSSNIRDISVAFPPGLTVNPAAADGLQACPETLAGFQGFQELPSLPGFSSMIFSPELTEPLQPGVNVCPDASKIGKVVIRSPLLPAGQLVQGGLYLAEPAPNGEAGKNPFNTLLAAYIIAKDPVSGVVVKLPGSISLDPSSGQMTASFKNNPDLAVEDAEIQLLGGQRAPFASPAHCATYTATATFTPWSGGPDATSSSSFPVQSGPNGTPCPPASLPFAPTLAAGTTSNTAASFSPLTTTISREDGEQFMNSVTLHMPPGLAGVLTGVPLCPDAQANAGTCSSASLIGHTTASVGVGKNPFTVTGGQVFLTEAYKGASFGLSILTPAVAGPFNLGTVIVRAKVEINPITAALTVTTDEIPHILKGVPLDIRHVNVTIDRPGFTFNPTSCNPMSVTGTIGALEGATAPVSDPFQATNCAALQFTPTVAVATAGKASKPNGASLNFKIAYPKGALGTQSWFNEAKFTLPKQLPARLTTIQKACDSKIFEGNRAACPAGSKIGTAIVHTPVLPVPLEGPVYFVSYGNAQFPEAVLVLDGYGVHIELHGETFIGKGVTSATFRNTPDVPFESIEVTLPTGPFSEFGANLPHNSYNFCGQKLVMPTLLKAQNGMEVHQNTPVGVSGCPPSVSIVKTAVKGNSVAVTVKLGQQGTVKITGRGLRTTTKRGLKAGTRVINVPLTAVGRAAKRHGGKLKVQASLTVSGKTGTATATLRA